MSQPHTHRASGPLFHFGDDIVEELQLEAALYLQRRSRAECNPSTVSVSHVENESEITDVEPDDVPIRNVHQSESKEYRAKKKMSSLTYFAISLSQTKTS